MAVCWIENASLTEAVLYCSTTMQAFGPVFEEMEGYTAGDMVEWFLWWVEKYKHSDARRYDSEELSRMKGWWYGFLREVSLEADDVLYASIPMDVEKVEEGLEKRE